MSGMASDGGFTAAAYCGYIELGIQISAVLRAASIFKAALFTRIPGTLRGVYILTCFAARTMISREPEKRACRVVSAWC